MLTQSAPTLTHSNAGKSYYIYLKVTEREAKCKQSLLPGREHSKEKVLETLDSDKVGDRERIRILETIADSWIGSQRSVLLWTTDLCALPVSMFGRIIIGFNQEVNMSGSKSIKKKYNLMTLEKMYISSSGSQTES